MQKHLYSLVPKTEPMRKLPLAFLALALLFLSACAQSQSPTAAAVVQEPLCKAPYYEYRTGECCLDQNGNSVCDVDEPPAEAEPPRDVLESATLEEPAVETEEPADSGTIDLHAGESAAFLGLSLRLNTLDMVSGTLQIELDVQGKVFPMKGTKSYEILAGKKLTLLSYHDGVNLKGGPFVTLTVEPFSLGPDEYLFFQGLPQTVKSETFQLTDVFADGTAILDRVGTPDTLSAKEGRPFEVGDLQFTLLKGFERPYRTDEYIWVAIVPA